jgi:murein L,D-transpeptidase YcbB/YkuD
LNAGKFIERQRLMSRNHCSGRTRKAFCGVFAAALMMLACGGVALGQEAADEALSSAPPNDSTAIRAALERIGQSNASADAEALRRFYEQIGYRTAWGGETGVNQTAEIARRILDQAGEEGLEPSDYSAPIPAFGSVSQFSEDNLASQDLAFTDAFIRYMNDVRIGRVDPSAIGPLIGLEQQNYDAATALTSALEAGTFESIIADLPPPHEQYAALKAELSRYRQLEERGGWSTLSSQSEIVLTEDDARIALLRQRLAAEFSELEALTSGDDRNALDRAVRLYQRRNGLEPDGRVGPRTLEMLNVPVATRIEQIEANMERWRWMPRQFEPRYVSVNVPDTTLEVVENGETVLTSRVIVGNPRTPTPVFRAEITGVTANPPWNVPASIARNEMLPRLQSDPNYLADRNMILVNGPEGDPSGQSVAWAQISRNAFPYQIRQLPGPGNALGEIKLELPNRFSVFLHDTSARNLFSRMDRFLSHGCVRVQEIHALASHILEHNSGYAADSLEGAIASGNTTLLRLSEPLPVYILYWTALTNGDGSFGFRHDIYRRDARLLSAIENRSMTRVVFQGNLGCPLPS